MIHKEKTILFRKEISRKINYTRSKKVCRHKTYQKNIKAQVNNRIEKGKTKLVRNGIIIGYDSMWSVKDKDMMSVEERFPAFHHLHTSGTE